MLPEINNKVRRFDLSAGWLGGKIELSWVDDFLMMTGHIIIRESALYWSYHDFMSYMFTLFMILCCEFTEFIGVQYKRTSFAQRQGFTPG